MNNKVTSYTSAGLALIIPVGVIVLIVTGHTVPGEVWSAFGVVIGFFFGSNTNSAKA